MPYDTDPLASPASQRLADLLNLVYDDLWQWLRDTSNAYTKLVDHDIVRLRETDAVEKAADAMMYVIQRVKLARQWHASRGAEGNVADVRELPIFTLEAFTDLPEQLTPVFGEFVRQAFHLGGKTSSAAVGQLWVNDVVTNAWATLVADHARYQPSDSETA
ncbi:hypothetical protein [Amycolatopsis sp. NBC_01286]|uniref:hypothetical protein n=1 Tax=Amycolatopsis sp. NBC_01286 TaxID=2903560 RepID=UPI002E0E5495|nr:hypothetical protein OG570_48080 [Amycolatopsis sp. NBC_01286]